MSLKELLGDDLYDRVVEKAGDQKIDIVSNGSWFPKERFDQVNNEKKDLKSQLDDRDRQLSTLQKQAKGNEDLQDAIEQLKKENKKVSEDYQKKLFNFALESALRDAKAKNIKAVKANLNVDGLELSDDKVIGLDEQLTALKESDSYLFEAENDSSPGLAGRQPHVNPSAPLKGNITKEQFEKMGYSEREDLYRKNPELYQQLTN
ncbi:phage scaffolding protein [Bacillus pumilus]|uniref:phage scaffolding protein n=1 Tax=Bacillus pumilus TaxID=1408 RepID=UPI00042EAD6B|nr:phage scaffolding protein [Bacillus pumilus]AHL70861.1 scaffolding protein [Bacillus pumilus]